MSGTPTSDRLSLVDEAVRTTVARLLDENQSLKTALAGVQARIAELERLADLDTLTPLPNRRAFLREVERAVARIARYGSTGAVMYVDVDGLKALNDRYGHGAGDAALNHVATLLRRGVRAGDLVARIGGDEFALLVESVDEAVAIAKADAVVAAIAHAPLEWEGAAVAVTISIGVTMIEARDGVEDLLARADARMYAAKGDQRSRR